MNQQIGRAGVFLVAARLEKMGVQVALCDTQGFDLVAFVPEPIRIEVKASARGPVRHGKLEFNASKGGNKRILRECHADILALADLKQGFCVFRLVKNLTSKNLKVEAYQFCESQEQVSWERSIKELRNAPDK